MSVYILHTVMILASQKRLSERFVRKTLLKFSLTFYEFANSI